VISLKTRFKKSIHKVGPGQRKFGIVMKEYNKGNLHDSHGNIVENPKQAVAIAYSEAKMHESAYEKREHKFETCKTCGGLHKDNEPHEKTRHPSRFYVVNGFDK
jgi:hypothetical protein